MPAIVLAAVLMAGCTGSTDATDTGAEPVARDGADGTAAYVPSTLPLDEELRELEPAPCPDPTTPTERITCSTLVLAEDRSAPDARQVELPVLQLSPAGGPLGGPPLVYLHGGPGAGVTRSWATWLSLVDGLGRDVVLYDQRGAGAATPLLACPEHAEAFADVLGRPRSWSSDRELIADALARCHERLREQGVGLDHYDTPTSTQDLEQLRRALGVESMTLVGSSYGTRLALDYTRTYPEHVASLVLDGVDPPGTGGPAHDRQLPESAIDALVQACRVDAGCAAGGEDLEVALEQAAMRLDREPVRIEAPSADGSTSTSVLVDGDALVAGVVAAMYDTELITLIPSVLRSMAQGDDSVLGSVGARLGPALSSSSIATMTSVNCADHGRRALDDEGAAALDADPGRASLVVLSGSDSFCDVWSVDTVADGFGTLDPASFDGVSVLVVTGELDPVTPAAPARRLATALDAQLVEVARGGHSPLLVDRCAMVRLGTFLADPDAQPPECESNPAPFSPGAPGR